MDYFDTYIFFYVVIRISTLYGDFFIIIFRLIVKNTIKSMFIVKGHREYNIMHVVILCRYINI